MILKIAMIQTNIIWEDATSTLKSLDRLLRGIDRDVDLIVLPEMFATGFSMNSNKIAQGMNGQVVAWLKQKAKDTGAAIMGSQAIADTDKIYNRALFALPNQHLMHYDKRHLFSPGKENLNYSRGLERIIFNYKGIRILPQICYDLRFPVWSRNKNDYDLAIYIANWPAPRQNVWNILTKARAIENQCYVCAVNRIGTGDGIDYKGQSQGIDFKGEAILNMQQGADVIGYCNFDFAALKSFKDKFAAHKDADDFNLVTT